MSRANIRAYFMLLGGMGGVLPPVTHECDPYIRPGNEVANQNLSTELVRVDNTLANVTLCEEMT